MVKNLVVALVFIFIISACGNSQSNKTSDNRTGNNIDNEIISMKPIDLTKQQFLMRVFDYEKSPEKWQYSGDKPAIIDFYATWCGPCKIIEPVLDELAVEYAGEIYIYKIDVDKEPQLAEVFEIRSIPSLMFIPLNGQPQMMQDVLTKESFKEVIDNVLFVRSIN